MSISTFIKILNKNNIKNVDNTNETSIFLELCKIPHIQQKNLKYFIDSPNLTKTDKYSGYRIIYNLLEKNINNYKDETVNDSNILNILLNLKLFFKNINKEEVYNLKEIIHNKINDFVHNKTIYSSLKSFLIYLNKIKVINPNKIIIKILNEIVYESNSDQDPSNKKLFHHISKLKYYINKKYTDIDYNQVINVFSKLLENKILTNDDSNIILDVISTSKKMVQKYGNDIEKILYIIDNNIHDYIFFLNNNDNIIITKEQCISFLSQFNYTQKECKDIDSLNLKRGFIFNVEKNDKQYIVKYQPNKSVMELIINSYVKKLNKSMYFLIPTQFFINSDNSYFYIIEKYDTDLYKYFHLLFLNNKILRLLDIIKITQFLVNAIYIMQINNIIHCDLKLENIVLNYDKTDFSIIDLKLIDFDVAIFNTIPNNILSISDKYDKIMKNKKPRGTRIYMIKDKNVDFKNDIFSLGVILLIILYKNLKLIISINKKNKNVISNKKLNIKYQTVVKKLNTYREKIEENNIKIKSLTYTCMYYEKNKSDLLNFYEQNNNDNLEFLKNLITDCIQLKIGGINDILTKYQSYLE